MFNILHTFCRQPYAVCEGRLLCRPEGDGIVAAAVVAFDAEEAQALEGHAQTDALLLCILLNVLLLKTQEALPVLLYALMQDNVSD